MTAAGFLRIMLDTARKGCKGNGGLQSGSLCRRVQGEGHSLLRGAGGWKPLAVGPGRVIPAVGVQRGEATPLVGVVGGKASRLNRVKYSVPTEWDAVA